MWEFIVRIALNFHKLRQNAPTYSLKDALRQEKCQRNKMDRTLLKPPKKSWMRKLLVAVSTGGC